MSFVRSKMINGCGPYYYEVKSVRKGKKVRQVHIRYIGRNGKTTGVRTSTTPTPVSKTDALRPKKYYHVIRSERTHEILTKGLEGREEIDEKKHVYVWDNPESARRYREMLKEDYPNTYFDILEVRVPKKEAMEPWTTYGLPGAKSIDTEGIAAKNIRLIEPGRSA